MANVTLRNVKKAYPNGFEAIKGVDVVIGFFELHRSTPHTPNCRPTAGRTRRRRS